MSIIGVLPFIFANGTTADAIQVDADFAAIVSDVNNNAAAKGSAQDIPPFFVGVVPSTGSANAHTVATTYPNNFSTGTFGSVVSFTSGYPNTGATTLNVNSTGNFPLEKISGGGLVALAPGDLLAGGSYSAQWNGSAFVIGAVGAPGTVAPGGIPAGAGGGGAAGQNALLNDAGATQNHVMVGDTTGIAPSPVIIDKTTGEISGFLAKGRDVTGSCVLAATDTGAILRMLSAGASVTCAGTLPAGFVCEVIQLNSGNITISPGTGVLHNRQTQFKIAGQYGAVKLDAISTGTFVLTGDTVA